MRGRVGQFVGSGCEVRDVFGRGQRWSLPASSRDWQITRLIVAQLTNRNRDVGFRDLRFPQPPVKVRSDPDRPERASFGEDVLRVEHRAIELSTQRNGTWDVPICENRHDSDFGNPGAARNEPRALKLLPNAGAASLRASLWAKEGRTRVPARTHAVGTGRA